MQDAFLFMTTFITQFTLAPGAPVEEIRKAFVDVAPQFQQVPGLLSKTFLLSDDATRGGGVYVWRSKADAKAYEPYLRTMIRTRMGVEAEITYFNTPVVVDNIQGQVRKAVATAAD